jgi:hypothetical protein
VIGFAMMWVLLLIYSRLIFGVTMNVPFGLSRVISHPPCRAQPHRTSPS